MNLFTLTGLLKVVSYSHVLHSVRQALKTIKGPQNIEAEFKLKSIDEKVKSKDDEHCASIQKQLC